MTYLVYKHTSPSGKSYIGITNDYDRRCTEHQRDPRCRAFHNAIKKYGWDNFTHEILLDQLSEEEALRLEPALILEHDTRYPRGYNLSEGGRGSSLLPESIERLRAHRQANPISAEQQKRMAEARKGKQFSEERKKNLSEAAKKRPKRPHTPETKEKLRQAALKKWGAPTPN